MDYSLGDAWQAASGAGPFLTGLLGSMTTFAVLFAGLGVVLAVLFVVLAYRSGVLRRDHRGWNLGAKLWYPLVLCLLPLAGAASGAAFGAHRVCDRLIEDALKPALVAAMPGLRQAMAERLAPLSGDMTVTARDLVRPIVQDLLYEPADDSFSERLKARLFNGLLYKAGAFALTQAFGRALDALPEVVKSPDSRASGDLAAFGAQSVMSVLAGAGARADFSQLDKSVPQIFTEAMHEQTAALFAGVYLSIALYAVGLAMAIACEALLYFRFYLPRRAQPGLAPVA
ncbi:hypothetical protein [Nitrogeniibacter aestuarii]|uniref:hypothetical protein n=1 Tax=Nitrogeniibacter aestuarii TaxID=2815343 RepID=UPI001D1043EE|nr:hypothetical protein [Nitrogeniibacter aestuarii]